MDANLLDLFREGFTIASYTQIDAQSVLILKGLLKVLWYAPSEDEARQRWQVLAESSGLAPVQQFARRLKGCVEGIIASAVYRMNSSVLEGVNSKIKDIKQMA